MNKVIIARVPQPEAKYHSPFVSVIVPVFNGAAFLSEAIASIRAQNYAPLEIIVVDDGSTDATARVAAALGDDIHYLYQQNQGPAAARNRGLARATGDVIAFLDADDMWTRDKLALQLGALAPETEIVMGYNRAFETDPEVPLPLTHKDGSAFLAHQMGSALVRRSVVQRIGGFDETLRFSEDIDWFLRAREAGISIRVIPEVTLLYRVHSSNMTRAAHHSHYLTRAIRSSIQRRRQSGSGGELTPLQMPERH